MIFDVEYIVVIIKSFFLKYRLIFKTKPVYSPPQSSVEAKQATGSFSFRENLSYISYSTVFKMTETESRLHFTRIPILHTDITYICKIASLSSL